MAQLVNTSIDINGKSIKQFSSLNISQGIFEHHTFRLVCPSEAIDSPRAQLFDSSKDFIGAPIKIKMESVGGSSEMNFFGIITRVEADRFSGHAGNISFHGFSPTILMDNAPDCQTFEKRKLKFIATFAMANFSKDLLSGKTDIAPVFGDEILYTAQYMETAWQFLYRLAAMYGEWFFYDGQKLFLGPPKGKQTKLVYGNNLHQFTMSLRARQTQFFTFAHDYVNDEDYFSTVVDKNIPRSKGNGVDIASKNGLKDISKFVYDKSQDLYTFESRMWNNQFLTSKKELDDFVTIRASAQSSKMVNLSGASDNLELLVGGSISVEGKNVFTDDTNEPFGDYTVTAVTHQCNGQGNYSNFFEAIPASTKIPPITGYSEPRCETQSAVVTDNNDPKGLGRIRVRFHWMKDDEKSPWIRVTTPYAGSEKGLFFMPEIKEEVLVGFEGGSAAKPYIIGCVWNGKAKNSSANGSNSTKIIKAKSGLSITLDDGAGSITLSDKKNNTVTLDGGGNISVNGSETIKLDSAKSKISLAKDGVWKANGVSVTLEGDDAATVRSKGASYNADGKANESKVSGKTATLHADADATVEGLSTKVKGTAKLDVNGGIVTINC